MTQNTTIVPGSEFANMCTCGKTDWCDIECIQRDGPSEETPKVKVYHQPSLSELIAPLLNKYGK